MSTELVRKFRLHAFWQDDKEEAWLEQMAAQGLHLVKRWPAAVWTFRRGAPQRVAYRLDYRDRRPGREYTQLFEDAGWERVLYCSGWNYWRKAYDGERAPEIFTDSASKASKYKRMLGVAVILTMPAIISALNPHTYHMAGDSLASRIAMICLTDGVALAALYVMVRLAMRIHALRAAP